MYEFDVPNYRKRVGHAAKFLDVQVPGWHELIQPECLHMSDCHMCVLGQLFGSANEAVIMRIIGEPLPPLCKFSSPFGRGSNFLEQHGGNEALIAGAFSSDIELRCMWVEEIAERMAQDAEDTSYTSQTA